MSGFQPFEMERWMSKFEQTVEYNLSESGVHPMRVSEVLAGRPGAVEDLVATELNYPHVNGIPELREHIAAMYEGCGPDNVLVTTGAIEANYNTIRTLLSPGDGIAVMLPNYMQVWGLAKNHGLDLRTFGLREDTAWGLDVDELNAAVTADTKLVAVCNPNNPTGHILADGEMDAIVAAADRVGAWILADEVYTGAEREMDDPTPSFFGRYDKVIATGSTSKAYGLPGLRIGWAAGPPGTIDEIWARHEYTSLSATMLSNHLAAIALSPEVKPRIIQRTRDYIRHGYPVLQEWVDRHPGVFELVPPQAAAIAFVRYHIDINSTELIERLRKDKSVLIVPGDHFGMDRFLRISFGLPHDYLTVGLDRIHDLVTNYGSERSEHWMEFTPQEAAKEARAADTRIRPLARETDLERSPYYRDVGGAEVYFKLENLQHTGSFKARGALNKVLALTESELNRGVVAASTGNHGAAVAFAAGQVDARAVVFVPENASRDKLRMVERLGAEVRFHGDDCRVAELAARRYATEQGLVYVSPYNDPMVVAGQGTIGVELERQLDRLDAVFISLGGGGLISGVAAYLESVRPEVRVVGCSPEHSQVMIQSVQAGEILDLPSRPTLSDGTAGGIEPGAITFDLCRALVDDYITVTEQEIADSWREFTAAHHMMIEGAAAVAIASFMKLRTEFTGKNVVVVLCGANISLETVKELLS